LVKAFLDKSGQEVLEISWIHSSPGMLTTHLSQELLQAFFRNFEAKHDHPQNLPCIKIHGAAP
jgi:hypothetical protein